MIPLIRKQVNGMEITPDTMEAIDSLLCGMNKDLNKILGNIMPQRTAEMHFTMLLGVGLFVSGYAHSRNNCGLEIEEALQFGLNQMMENPEIQATFAQMMAQGFHSMMGGGLR